MNYNKQNPLRVITLFSGYDSQCLALNRLGIEYDLVAWSDIDKFAIEAHNALFPKFEGRNLGDVSKIDWKKIKEPIDLLTYSSPCTDFSMAGKMAGGEEGSGTRSSLLWEVDKAIQQIKPKYLLFENVPAIVCAKFSQMFNKWQKRLDGYGYTNFVQIMNAKDYGCPQNRRRLFMVSILNCVKPYYFPKPFTLEKNVSGLLERNVNEMYYLSESRVSDLLQRVVKNEDPELCQVLGWTRDKKGVVTDYHPVVVANCVTANKRDNTQNYVLQQTLLNGDKEGNITTPKQGHKHMGVLEVLKGGQKYLVMVRKLTERELYRIMDVDEKVIDKILSTSIPRSQHPKLAGNSIVISCLYHIFKNLFCNDEVEINQQLKLF